LTPQQLAECFVRLKHAIDGGFYIVEVSPSASCSATPAAPSATLCGGRRALCRMTSSVFGGIAARNGDNGAGVVLEERIAVGDPGCRVVVHLGAVPPATVRFAHAAHSAPAPA
jgi:hypothetical protein